MLLPSLLTRTRTRVVRSSLYVGIACLQGLDPGCGQPYTFPPPPHDCYATVTPRPSALETLCPSQVGRVVAPGRREGTLCPKLGRAAARADGLRPRLAPLARTEGRGCTLRPFKLALWPAADHPLCPPLLTLLLVFAPLLAPPLFIRTACEFATMPCGGPNPSLLCCF